MSSATPARSGLARDYDSIAHDIAGRLDPGATREQRMRAVVDTLWETLNDRGLSWVGFYLHAPDAPGASDQQPLILGPRRDKPACSPIGLHGVCGQSFTTRSVRIVHDVKDLGDDYIACDPRDRSEIVLPMIEENDDSPQPPCWGVLDLDSFDVGAFTTHDEEGLRTALNAAGLRTA
jgi:putative methionine-R-sulfoxide reductase with GAF domain